jgi:uncharacterized membrane protein
MPTNIDPNVNPYQPPAARIQATGADLGAFIPGGRRCPAGAGLTWIGQGWQQFASAPGAWLGATVLFFVLAFVIALLPLVSLLGVVFNVVFLGGLYLGCRATDRGEPFEFRYLFEGFRSTAFGRLAGVGAVLLVFNLLFFIVLGVAAVAAIGFSGFPDFNNLAAQWNSISSAIGLASVFVVLLLIYLSVIIMLGLFSPILAVVFDQPVMEALKGSFVGSWRNMLSLTVFGIACLVLGLLCILTLGLGILVVAPVTWAAVYYAARDIYEQ